MENVYLKIKVSGRVQGVGYRWFAKEQAQAFGLSGSVRNLADGRVEVFVAGPQQEVYEFIGRLREGPSLARVLDLEIVEADSAQAPVGPFEVKL